LLDETEYEGIIFAAPRGGLAQLGERLNGIEEVVSSILSSSTTILRSNPESGDVLGIVIAMFFQPFDILPNLNIPA